MKYTGLSKEEVRKSYEAHGNNALSSKKTETFLEILVGAFDDPWIKVLLAGLLLKVAINVACIGDWTFYGSCGIFGVEERARV